MLIKRDDSLLLVIDVQEKLVPVIHGSERVVDNCGWLMRAATEFDVPTLITEQYPEGLGATVPALTQYAEKDVVIAKTHFSAVSEAAFIQRLRASSRHQVIVCGMEAHVCVTQTCIELIENQYRVFLVEDAVSSRNKDDRFTALERLRGYGVELVSKEMVFFEWQRFGGGDEFRDRITRYFSE